MPNSTPKSATKETGSGTAGGRKNGSRNRCVFLYLKIHSYPSYLTICVCEANSVSSVYRAMSRPLRSNTTSVLYWSTPSSGQDVAPSSLLAAPCEHLTISPRLATTYTECRRAEQLSDAKVNCRTSRLSRLRHWSSLAGALPFTGGRCCMNNRESEVSPRLVNPNSGKTMMSTPLSDGIRDSICQAIDQFLTLFFFKINYVFALPINEPRQSAGRRRSNWI